MILIDRVKHTADLIGSGAGKSETVQGILQRFKTYLHTQAKRLESGILHIEQEPQYSNEEVRTLRKEACSDLSLTLKKVRRPQYYLSPTLSKFDTSLVGLELHILEDEIQEEPVVLPNTS